MGQIKITKFVFLILPVHMGDLMTPGDRSYNLFYSNNIHKNSVAGIWIDKGVEQNCITNNQIYSNSSCGIYLGQWDAEYNRIVNNVINVGPTTMDIDIEPYGYSISYIANNIISHHLNFGIEGLDMYSSIIENNIIFSNSAGGLYFNSYYYSPFNMIISNTFFGKNQPFGIYFYGGGSLNQILYNTIKNNNREGISLGYGNYGLQLKYNQILTNVNYGIFIVNSFAINNCKVVSNLIAFQNYGICIEVGNYDLINFNQIYSNHISGISLTNCTYSTLSYNNIYYNNIGLSSFNSTNYIQLNSITNNIYGVELANGIFGQCSKNNLWPNYRYALSNIAGVPQKMTNNWWGSTLATNIQKKIYGLSGYSNFTPYRLFGLFDVKPNADTTPPSIINIISAVTNAGNIILNWNQSPAGDFVKYSIYRSPIPGTTNLSRNFIVTNIYSQNITSFTDHPGFGFWYYTITALDSSTPFTNESWYAKVTNAVINFTTTLSLLKSISNITLNAICRPAIPGATIIYKISYSNTGNTKAYYTSIYDKIIPYVTYNTQGYGNTFGWSFEYSTNNFPNQGYISSDYSFGNPINKNKVKWIRWIKNQISTNEKGLYLWYTIVIK